MTMKWRVIATVGADNDNKYDDDDSNNDMSHVIQLHSCNVKK